MRFKLKDDKRNKNLHLTIPPEASKKPKEKMGNIADNCLYFRKMLGEAENDYVLRLRDREGVDSTHAYYRHKGLSFSAEGGDEVIKVSYSSEQQAAFYKKQIKKALNDWHKRTK